MQVRVQVRGRWSKCEAVVASVRPLEQIKCLPPYKNMHLGKSSVMMWYYDDVVLRDR